MLVTARADALDPLAELRMQPRAPRLRQAPVGNLPSQSVLEDVLHLAFE